MFRLTALWPKTSLKESGTLSEYTSQPTASAGVILHPNFFKVIRVLTLNPLSGLVGGLDNQPKAGAGGL